jgi:hypothetical protein
MPIVEVKSYVQGELVNTQELPQKKKVKKRGTAKSNRKKENKQVTERVEGVDEAPQAEG